MKQALFVLLALPIFALAEGGLPDQPYIYIEGKAEIEKPADMATLRFDLVARNADQAKANQEVQAKATKILTMLNDRKIAETDVIASDLKSEPQYDGNNDDSARKRGKILGYSVSRSFTAKVRELSVFPKLVDELLAIPGVEFSGIEAGLAEEKDLQDQVWEKALANARDRAERTLTATGMKMDSVFALSPIAFPEIQRNMLGASLPTADYESAVGSAKFEPSQYRLGPIKVSQSVHIIYLISPAK